MFRLSSLAAIALTVVLAACGGDSVPQQPATAQPASQQTSAAAPSTADETITLAADSGDIALSVAFPEGALPSGTRASDITIAAMTEPPVDLDGSVIAAFEFTPDGLRFEHPIEVVVSLPALDDGVAISAALLSSSGDIEGLDPAIGPPQGQDGPLTLRFQIEHFSVILITSYNSLGHQFSVVEPIPENEYKVGESFTVNLRIDRAKWELDEPDLRVTPMSDAAWDVWSHWVVDLRGTLEPGLEPGNAASSPTFFLDRGAIVGPDGGSTTIPKVSVDSGDSRWEQSQTFVCARPGPFAANFVAQVREEIDVLYNPRHRPFSAEEVSTFEATVTGRCKLPPILVSAAPPDTTYTIDLSVDGFSFGWSGADCGTTSGTDTNTFVWSHGDESCKHTEEAHASTTISLLISSDKFQARCTYLSAASGSSDNCELVE